MSNFRAAVVIPCYNHGSTIHEVIDGIRYSELPVLIVDDGSDAATKEVLDDVAASESHVAVLRMSQNSGKGAAVCAGFSQLIAEGYTHAIQIDADAQHNFADIQRVLDLSSAFPEKMILGYPVYDESVPSHRLHGRKVSNFWTAVDAISGEIKDALCGFRCYPLNKIDLVMKKYKIGERMTFDPSVAIYLYWEGVEAINFDTKVRYPEGGISHFRMFEDNVAFSWFFCSHFFRMLPRAPKLLWWKLTRKNSSPWHKLPERGSLWGLKLTLNLYRILGPRLIWFIGYQVLFYFFLTGKSAREASQTYLNRLYEEGALSEKPKFWDSFKHFVSFGQAILDRLTIYLGKGKRFKLTWHGRETIYKYIDNGQGVLLTGAHLGSFELLRLLADERDSEKVHALMYTKQAQMMNKIFRETKGASEMNVIGLEDMNLEKMLYMRELIGKAEHIGILADRPAVNAEEKVERVPFLGKDASFPVGPWQLAGFLKAPILLIFGVRTAFDTYEIFCEEFEPVLTDRGKVDVKATTAAYAKRVEHYCKTYPYQWFNFYDFWR